MNTELKEIFGSINDPRIERTKLHKLLDIIALGIVLVTKKLSSAYLTFIVTPLPQAFFMSSIEFPNLN